MHLHVRLILSLLSIGISASAFALAELSLKSTNDYFYISFPTNRNLQILGKGVGTKGGYNVIRDEDVAFLTEAANERNFVSIILGDWFSEGSKDFSDYHRDYNSKDFRSASIALKDKPRYNGYFHFNMALFDWIGDSADHAFWDISVAQTIITPEHIISSDVILTNAFINNSHKDRHLWDINKCINTCSNCFDKGYAWNTSAMATNNVMPVWRKYPSDFYQNLSTPALSVLTNAYTDIARNNHVMFWRQLYYVPNDDSDYVTGKTSTDYNPHNYMDSDYLYTRNNQIISGYSLTTSVNWKYESDNTESRTRYLSKWSNPATDTDSQTWAQQLTEERSYNVVWLGPYLDTHEHVLADFGEQENQGYRDITEEYWIDNASLAFTIPAITNVTITPKNAIVFASAGLNTSWTTNVWDATVFDYSDANWKHSGVAFPASFSRIEDHKGSNAYKLDIDLKAKSQAIAKMTGCWLNGFGTVKQLCPNPIKPQRTYSTTGFDSGWGKSNATQRSAVSFLYVVIFAEVDYHAKILSEE